MGSSKRDAELKHRLDANQLRELREEVASLGKQQDEARRTEIYIPMTKQETADFDSRQQRISHIWTILSEYGFKR
jgi:hypothetical protein